MKYSLHLFPALLCYTHVLTALRVLPPLLRCPLAGISASHPYVMCFSFTCVAVHHPLPEVVYAKTRGFNLNPARTEEHWKEPSLSAESLIMLIIHALSSLRDYYLSTMELIEADLTSSEALIAP